MQSTSEAAAPDSGLAPRLKRDALQRVLQSSDFQDAERLSDFLKYIVEEEISGRGDSIRGKTIAQDVFDRDPSKQGYSENIVRVSARRIRQMLELYYETEGKSDPVRIHLESGGYCPRFDTNAAPHARVDRRFKIAVPVLTFATGAVLGAILTPVIFSGQPDARVETDAVERNRIQALRREAVYEKSPASLQAINLADQARSMIFPIFDRHRQELMRGVFQRVAELDPDNFSGFAGEAQTVATLAILAPDGQQKDELRAIANELASEAMRLDPEESWTQSAFAWSAFANGDYDRALRVSKRATEINPDDGHTLDFHGAIALFSGEFDEAIKASNRQHVQGRSNQRFANRNIFAASSFHLGNLRQSVDAFREAAEFGDPISAPSLAYQIAALSALGQMDAAREKLAELNRAWPGVPLDKILYGVHSDRANADAVLDHLRALGWRQG